jgi:general secretion pathway protein G
MKTQKDNRRQGFSLIELMVVLAILAVLAVAIVPNVVGKSDKAKHTKAQADIAVIEGLLDQFYLDMGRYPTTDEGLRVLYYPPGEDEEESRWSGPYAKKPVRGDPWGHPFIYESPGVQTSLPYELLSLGKDGEEGGTEYDADVASWEEEDDQG